MASSSSWVPSATMRPWSSSTTRSARAMVAGRWAITMVVRSRMTSASASRISCSLVGSTDEVASSRISTRGSARIGPGDGDALALAAREREPALADLGAVAVGQRGDELVGAGQPGGPVDLLVVGVGIGEGDVVGDRVAEQEGLLEHDADRPGAGRAARGRGRRRRRAGPVRRRRRRSGAAAGPRSTCRCRWRPTSATDSPCPMARLEVLEHGHVAAALVGERHVVEAHLAAGRRQTGRRVVVDDDGIGGQHGLRPAGPTRPPAGPGR